LSSASIFTPNAFSILSAISAASEDVMFKWRLLVADGHKAGHTSSQPAKNLIGINVLNRSRTSSAEIGVIVSRRYQSGEISNTLGKYPV
jgi:hypothetical protein